MKKVLNLFVLVCFLAGVAALNSCKKDPDMPALTTAAVSNITTISATSGGNVTGDGGAEVTARGVCWGTSSNPTVSGSKVSDSKGGIGSFVSNLTGLTPNTTYYVRAYATNSAGTSYGNEVSFSTNPITGANVTTTAVSAITTTTATSGGEVTSDGGGEITARGVCYATTANPDLTKSVTTNGTGTGVFTSNLTGLTPGTLYHVRAYATNASGTTYGADVQFTTLANLPTVTTTAATSITQTAAATGGNVTANGGAPVTARGVCYGTATGPSLTVGAHTSDGSGDGAFTSSLTGLTPGTMYYVRAYATNSAGTAYGTEITFTTAAVNLPAVTTAAVTAVTNNSAASGGNVTSDGGGAITARGVCWGTSSGPTVAGSHSSDGTTTGSFTSSLTGLSDGTLYYVRAYVTNSAGTAYGSEFTFLTRVADSQGYIYNTVVIGTQVWMSENLRTTVYNDNSAIPNVTGNAEWAALSTPAYAWYDNDEATNKPLYGAMYNYYAANAANICPTGWHVPSDAEFKTLEMFLGMSQSEADLTSWRGTDEGAKLKNTAGWTSGNGTNTSGFAAMPGGYRYYFDGGFVGAGTIAYFWSTTADLTPGRAFMRQLDNTHTSVERNNAGMGAGKSIRCLKN